MWLEDLRGSNRPRTAKITRVQAAETRRLRKAGVSTKELAAQYGLARNYISTICRGVTWKDATPEWELLS